MAETRDNREAGRQPAESDHQVREDVARPSAADFKSLPSGTGLGKYRILERIQTTHNSFVYKARDSMLDRLVTIKQMNPDLIDDPVSCGDFKREAQLLARIPKDARNVINIHELIEDEQGLFIVEEFAFGDRLETLISKRQVDATDAVRLLKTTCLGLHTLHSRKIVHRDIQPGNLMVTRSGIVRIINFGCAVHEGDITPPPILSAKYAAPELHVGRDHDARADIYALGLVVYELAVGRRELKSYFADIPTEPDAIDEYWHRWHCNPKKVLPDATSLSTAVAPALSNILREMTTKDLDHRAATAREILDTLARRFNVTRAQPQSAFPGGSAPRILEIRPPSFGSLGENPSIAGFGQPGRPAARARMLSQDQSTSTRGIERRSPSAAIDLRKPAGRMPLLDREPPFGAGQRAERRALQAARPAAPRPARPREVLFQPKKIEVHRKQRRLLLLPVSATLLALALSIASKPLIWDPLSGRKEREVVEKIIGQGIEKYVANDFSAARERLESAIHLSADNQMLNAERLHAELMLIMIEGRAALEGSDFEAVQRIIQTAEIRGADHALLDALRRDFWSKRDLHRLTQEGNEALERRDFAEVESKLKEFEEKAPAAGVDPSILRDRLERSMGDQRYEAALSEAQDALIAHEFEAAWAACVRAKAIRVTSRTRKLENDILNARKREDWIIRGEKALDDEDYNAAEAAFQSANLIRPSEDIEDKVRMAGAYRLFEDARSAIEKGDLLAAKRKLETAHYKWPNPREKLMRERMAPAFQAAELVKNADRALESGETRKAIRLYEEALPALPEPADRRVRQKLKSLGQASNPSTEANR